MWFIIKGYVRIYSSFFHFSYIHFLFSDGIMSFSSRKWMESSMEPHFSAKSTLSRVHLYVYICIPTSNILTTMLQLCTELLWAFRSSFQRRKSDKTPRLPGSYLAGASRWIADDTTGTSLELSTIVRAVFQPDRRARTLISAFSLHADAENSICGASLLWKRRIL